ncbi:hypothetical protein GBA52_028416 [Prunus armeniaca]|nr:hypothetical protein GBA52_028416 [Prunus armeniaca]
MATFTQWGVLPPHKSLLPLRLTQTSFLEVAHGDSRVDFTSERAAKEAELHMLASSGDPMLP